MLPKRRCVPETTADLEGADASAFGEIALQEAPEYEHVSEREIQVLGRTSPPPLPAWVSQHAGTPAFEAEAPSVSAIAAEPEATSLSPIAVELEEPVMALVRRRTPVRVRPKTAWLGVAVLMTVLVNVGATLILQGPEAAGASNAVAGASNAVAPAPAPAPASPLPTEPAALVAEMPPAVLTFSEEDAIIIAVRALPAAPVVTRPAPAPKPLQDAGTGASRDVAIEPEEKPAGKPAEEPAEKPAEERTEQAD